MAKSWSYSVRKGASYWTDKSIITSWQHCIFIEELQVAYLNYLKDINSNLALALLQDVKQATHLRFEMQPTFDEKTALPLTFVAFIVVWSADSLSNASQFCGRVFRFIRKRNSSGRAAATTWQQTWCVLIAYRYAAMRSVTHTLNAKTKSFFFSRLEKVCRHPCTEVCRVQTSCVNKRW